MSEPAAHHRRRVGDAHHAVAADRARAVRDAVAHVIAELDAGRLRVAEKIADGLDHAPVDQEGGAAVVPPRRQRGDAASTAPTGTGRHSRSTTRCRPSSPACSDAEFAAPGVRVVPPAVARRGAFIAPQRRADALVREHRRATSTRARWSTPGRPSAPARRSAGTCTCPAASASAACSSRCRPTRRSSRTTASSARARRSSRA